MNLVLIIETASGSVYEYNGSQIRRLPGKGEDVAFLRRDGEWIDCKLLTCMIGQPMRLVLTGLAPGLSTLRISTPVVDVREGLCS